MGELWESCLKCQNKCCEQDIACPLFVTEEELERIEKLYPDKAHLLNKVFPCPFLLENGLCMIHENKPIDCRFFPFDIIRVDGRICWVIWKTDCLIVHERERFEEYLKDLEEKFLPSLAPHLEAYSDFRLEELTGRYNFEILKEVGNTEIVRD